MNQPLPATRVALGSAIGLAGLLIAVLLSLAGRSLPAFDSLDPAVAGWLVVMPFAFFAPGVAALFWYRGSARQWLVGAAAIGLPLASSVTVWLATSTTWLNCEPVRSWLEAVPISAALGVPMGAVWAFAAFAAAAAGSAQGGRWRYPAAFLTGGALSFAGFWVVLVGYFLVFPAHTCAPH